MPGARPLPVYRFDGQAYVIPINNRGNCNSDGAIDAADFTAIALENLRRRRQCQR